VLAVRLFDSAGGFLDSIPVAVYEGAVPPAELENLGSGEPVVRFHPQFSLATLFMERTEGAGAPMLEVNIPLPAVGAEDDETVIVQYWISGLDIAEEFSQLDQRIFVQAGVAFIAGGLLIVGSLAWALQRLATANRLLQIRADDLSRTNRELAQSARTSAIGAITAHLMHGLRNPLAGLEGFVAAQGGEDEESDGEWASARESTRRLRALINEVHGVLSDVQNTADFDVTAGEVCAGLCERLQSQVNKRGTRIEISGSETPVLSAREAGLGGLVLANLVQNAIDASADKGRIRIQISVAEGAVDFLVSDEGSGLPGNVAADPFRPRRSSKPDGAGIGLAISRELARHGGGELVLEKTGSEGTTFRLRLPIAVSRRKGEVL
jgi:signal transduction histidine kinase